MLYDIRYIICTINQVTVLMEKIIKLNFVKFKE